MTRDPQPAPHPDEPDIAWRPAVSKTARPVYLAIADALAADILSGKLARGTRLPAQRALADALALDFTTVTRAYAEARKRGLVEGRVGQGTYVRGTAAAPLPAARTGGVDMRMNLPPYFDDPPLVARMWQGMASLEASAGLELLRRYQEAGGTLADRTAGARWLADRIPDVDPDRVLICPGAQGALLAIVKLLVAPGELICVEELTYPGFRALAAHLRLQLVGAKMDRDGMLPDAFDEICRTRKPKALYCTPTLHNPTTATMPVARRKAIAAIARQHDVLIIEDDAYGALPPNPMPPLSLFAPERSYYVAGVAKCLSPALRIAYVVPPDLRQAARLANSVRAMTSMASPLTAAIATRWIEDGTAAAVVAAIRKESAIRLQIAESLLPRPRLQSPADGFHLWLNLPPPWTRGEFIARLQLGGVGVVGSDAFAIAAPPEAVRLSLGVVSSRDELRQCLQLIADLLGEQPAFSATVV
jgi:DNA-binding transcriptional MocR family regulator